MVPMGNPDPVFHGKTGRSVDLPNGQASDLYDTKTSLVEIPTTRTESPQVRRERPAEWAALVDLPWLDEDKTEGADGLAPSQTIRPAEASARAVTRAVNTVPGFILRGLDLEAVLLGRGGQEAADTVGLPGSCLPDLGKCGSLAPADHFDDLGALAFGARV
jgi:hypothetical protein